MLKMIGAILISFVVILVGWVVVQHNSAMVDQEGRQRYNQSVKSYHEHCELDDPNKYVHDKAWQEHQALCKQMKQLLEQ
jgi:hypothetical protein